MRTDLLTVAKLKKDKAVRALGGTTNRGGIIGVDHGMDIKHEGNAGITQFLDPIHRFQASRHPNLVDVLPATPDGPWSRFVAPGATTARYPRLVPLDADHAPKLRKRTLTNLYNERPAWLAHAHGDLDAAVLAAYGWPADLPDSEILSRLLDLNLST